MEITVYHPVFALATLVIAALTGQVLLMWVKLPETHGRFVAIDGLRGYLALAVFVHHASIWFGYAQTGRWELPPAALFVHLGQSAVALFFMITAFLFFGKLLDDRSRGSATDWLRVFVSRVLRLYPLYLVVLTVMVLVVLVLSDGKLQVSGKYFLRTLAHWFLFTIFDAPNLNLVDETLRIVAGVTWSLPYEWFFYLSLPVLALVVGGRVSWRWTAMSVFAIAAFLLTKWQPIHLLSFCAGMMVAVAVRQPLVRALAPTWPITLLTLMALVAVVWLTQDGRNALAIGLLGIAFLAIASGNSLFGLLHLRVSRLLGEMAYSIYMLHGMLLFIAFKFFIGESVVRGFSAWAYWAVVLSLTPLLVCIAQMSFAAIERPAMEKVDWATRALRRRAAAQRVV